VQRAAWDARQHAERTHRISRSRLARGRCASRRDDGSAAWSAARPLGRRASARILVTRQTHGAPRSIGAGGELAALCATLLTRVELRTAEPRFGRLTTERLALPAQQQEQQEVLPIPLSQLACRGLWFAAGWVVVLNCCSRKRRIGVGARGRRGAAPTSRDQEDRGDGCCGCCNYNFERDRRTVHEHACESSNVGATE
jgi:hypothetical protein